jgi:hypothetical protein
VAIALNRNDWREGHEWMRHVLKQARGHDVRSRVVTGAWT